MGGKQLVHLEDHFKIGWWLSTRTSLVKRKQILISSLLQPTPAAPPSLETLKSLHINCALYINCGG